MKMKDKCALENYNFKNKRGSGAKNSNEGKNGLNLSVEHKEVLIGLR